MNKPYDTAAALDQAMSDLRAAKELIEELKDERSLFNAKAIAMHNEAGRLEAQNKKLVAALKALLEDAESLGIDGSSVSGSAVEARSVIAKAH